MRNISGLVALWNFDEDAGTTLNDTFGPHNGTITGTVAFNQPDLPADTSGGAIDFAGTGSASVPHSAEMELAAFTLSLWFKFNTLPVAPDVGVVLAKDQSGFTLGDFHIYVESGVLIVGFQSGAATFKLPVEPVIEEETAYHILIRVDASGFDGFLNGAYLGKNTSHTDAWASNTQALTFATAPWTVVLADVTLNRGGLYDRVLTESETLSLAQTTAPPVANDDVVSVPENATTSIAVLENDEVVGIPTLDTVLQPSGGDSIAVNGQLIDYTAGDVTVNTQRTAQYRVTTAFGSSVADLNVTVLASGAVVHSAANCYPETSSDTVVVDTIGELGTAVSAAPPGRHILIASNTYALGGTITLDGGGTQANPVVIRPQGAIGSVTFTGGTLAFASTSERLVLRGCNFTSNAKFSMQGTHSRIDLCQFRAWTGFAVFINSAFRPRISRCDFAEWTSHTGGGGAIRIEPRGYFPAGGEGLIDYCYIHDITPAAGSDNQKPVGTFAQAARIDEAVGAITVDHCLFRNIAIPVEGEVITMKNGGWVVSFCTFENVDEYLNFRTCNNCELRSCYFENTNHTHVWGDNHLIIGNRWVGGLNCWIGAGNATMDQVIAGSASIASYARCDSARVIGNRMGSGHLQLGGYWGTGTATLPCLNNNLWANTRDSGGDAHQFITGLHSGTTFNSDAEAFVAATKLLPGQVGRSAADDPLC